VVPAAKMTFDRSATNMDGGRPLCAEGSVRPYIAHDPERAMTFLQAWTADKNPHVRRLVSEGTRLRLPWAPRVPWLDQNPERG
jgi:3-methyladenine DNA glycosylase AlkC